MLQANDLVDVNANCLCDIINYYFPKSNEGTTTDSDTETSAGLVFKYILL